MPRWKKQPWEILDEVSDEMELEWDPIEELSILSDFVKKHCDPEALRKFAQDVANAQEKMSEVDFPPDVWGPGVDGWSEYNG